MKKNKTHAAPLRCRREVRIYGKDPLRAFCCRICARGVKRHKCYGCEESVGRLIADAFTKMIEGLANSAKATAEAIEAAAKEDETDAT